jgi:hypothetical protein
MTTHHHHQIHSSSPPVGKGLTVRLLEPCTSTWTTKLLGLATAVVGDEEGTVELSESLLEHVLAVLIHVLLVVGDQSLRDGLTDSIDLRSVATTADTNTDICFPKNFTQVSKSLFPVVEV